MNLKATACIPSRLDNIDYLLDLIFSIESQTLLPDKLLIIASGRPLEEINQSVKVLKNRISPILNYDIFVSSSKGLSNARNIAIDICDTEIIIFGDDDDIWHKDRVKLIVEAIEKNSPCLIKHFHNSKKGEKILPVPSKVKSRPNPLSVGFSNLIGGGSSIAGSLSIFKVIKFADYSNCEDWEFWIRAFLADVKIVQINQELVTYRIHSHRMTSSFKAVYKYESIIRFKFFMKSLIFIIGIILGFVKSTIRTFIRTFILFLENN